MEKILKVVAMVLVVVGGINWGLIGFFKFDLVATVFGDMSAVSRVIYALVGLSAIFMLIELPKMINKSE